MSKVMEADMLQSRPFYYPREVMGQHTWVQRLTLYIGENKAIKAERLPELPVKRFTFCLVFPQE